MNANQTQTTLAVMLEEVDAIFLKKHAACIGETLPITGKSLDAISLREVGLGLISAQQASFQHWRMLSTEDRQRLASCVVAFDQKLTELEKQRAQRAGLVIEELELFLRRQKDADAR
jgi:hypothetical protein